MMTLHRSIPDVVTDAVLDAAFALRRAVQRVRRAAQRRRVVRETMRFTTRDRSDAPLRPAPVVAPRTTVRRRG